MVIIAERLAVAAVLLCVALCCKDMPSLPADAAAAARPWPEMLTEAATGAGCGSPPASRARLLPGCAAARASADTPNDEGGPLNVVGATGGG